MNSLQLQLISLSGTKFDDAVYEVVLPTLDGIIGVLPGHMPLVSVAKPGVISVRHNEHDDDNLIDTFAVSGGVIEVLNNHVRVLVDEADHADDINEADARVAHERALTLKAEAEDAVSLERAQELVDRTAVRLQVAGLKRRHPRA